MLLQNILKQILNKRRLKIRGSYNKVVFVKNGKEFRNKSVKGLEIKIKGNNNAVKIHLPLKFKNSKIIIKGDNNSFEILHSSKFIHNTNFLLDQRANNRQVFIDEDFLCAGANIITALNESTLNVGRSCMISYDVHIRNHDGHTIYDKTTKEVIDKSFDKSNRNMKIGDNVWIGFRSMITRNLTISDWVIVGAGSILSKPIKESNVIYAGIPAKKVRKNIKWSHDNVDNFKPEIAK